MPTHDDNQKRQPTSAEVADAFIASALPTPRHKEIAQQHVKSWEENYRPEQTPAQADPIAESINDHEYRLKRLEALIDPDPVTQPVQFKATSRKARRFSIGGGFSRLVNWISGKER